MILMFFSSLDVAKREIETLTASVEKREHLVKTFIM